MCLVASAVMILRNGGFDLHEILFRDTWQAIRIFVSFVQFVNLTTEFSNIPQRLRWFFRLWIGLSDLSQLLQVDCWDRSQGVTGRLLVQILMTLLFLLLALLAAIAWIKFSHCFGIGDNEDDDDEDDGDDDEEAGRGIG